MKGWIAEALGKMAKDGKIDIQTGPFGTVLSASEFVEYGTPVISVREIRDGYIEIYPETPCVEKKTITRLPDYVLLPNDLVIARKGSL